MFRTTLLAALVCAASNAYPQTLPEELAHLVPLIGDEKALVEAARRFDIQQQTFIEWDKNLASQYRDEGQDELAETKLQDLRRRIDLIERAWQYVLQHYDNNARANNYYGEFLYDYRGDAVEALRLWNLAINQDPDLSSAHNNLGLHYMHTGGYERGLTHIGKALDLEPKNPDYLYNVAQMYLTHFHEVTRRFDMEPAKLYKEAMRMSRDAAKYAPDDYDIVADYATNFYAADNFDQEADWSEAAAAWREAHKVARTKAEKFYTLLNEGRTWLRAGNNANATAALQQAQVLYPDSDAVKTLLDRIGQPGAEAEAGVPSEELPDE